MSGALLGLLALLLVAGASLAVSAALGLRSIAELVLAAYVVAMAEIVALSLFLSLFGEMTRAALVTGCVAILVASIGLVLLASPARRPSLPRISRRSAGAAPVLALAAVTALALAYAVALIVGTAPNGWDQLNYHLARAALWVQAERVGYVDAAYDERINFFPPNGEIPIAFVLAVTRHETTAAFVQLAAGLACAVGIFALARRIGLDRRSAAFGALLFLTLPIVLLQSVSTKNDIVVGALLVAGTVFVLGDSWREIGLASVAIALAVGTKFTATYGLVVLLAFALLAPPGAWRPRRVLGLAAGALAGGYWYAVNLRETGLLLGDQSNIPGLTAPLEPPENLLNAYGLAVDTLDLSGATGSDVFLYGIAALAVAAGLALLGARSRSGLRAALLAGGLAASPLLLLVVATEVGRPSLLALHDALGSPRSYLAEGDDVISSPTTAGDTLSWFGPVGFVLALGIGVATVVLARRGSLPRVALVAASAPVVWLALVALTLTYHPWQGRFFIYPLALSAALWGLALRVPAIAWSSVALGAVTALLSLGHYLEKPSGLRLLDRSATVSVWDQERWQIQSQHEPALGPVLQFLDEEVPRDDSVALALGANDFGYPAFGPRLERRVELVPFGSSAAEIATDWLVANPDRAAEIDPTCWRRVVDVEGGAVFSREAGACVLPSSSG